MICKECQNELSQDEINEGACWLCGASITADIFPDNGINADQMIAGIEHEAEKRQDKIKAIQKNDEVDSERRTISKIHVFFTIVTILLGAVGIIWAISTEDILVVIACVLIISFIYCLFRLPISIAYLLCDIKENTSHLNKDK